MALDELRLLKHFGETDLATIDGYERTGGYKALRKALLEMEPDELLHELEESGLRGRGGAGFAMGKKASFLPKGSMDKYLCCNADESEPGAFKDRLLMQKNPHQLVEGILIGADWFKSVGTEKSTGTKIVSVSGNVRRPGNYEVELGMPSRDIVYGLAGGPPEGRRVKCWFPGGSSAPVLLGKDLDLSYDFET